MQTKLRKIRRRKIFSEELRREAVKEYEKGELTVLEISNTYQSCKASIYRWINKYSQFEKQDMQIVEKRMSNTKKIRDLETKIKELHNIYKQIKPNNFKISGKGLFNYSIFYVFRKDDGNSQRRI